MNALAGLTPKERELLVLLANGHTAKTAAVESGLSVAAVNERLRAARRKTGAVSSRELARLLAQENRDEQIGLSSSSGTGSAATSPAARWTGRRTMMTMTILAAAAFGATLAIQQTPPTRLQPVDPVVGRILEQRSIAEWYRQVRDEGRDPEWAPKTEVALKERYARVPNLIANGNRLRVTCGRRTCEVATPMPKGLSREAESKLVDDLQSAELTKDVIALGLSGEDSSASFGESFVAYWPRATK